jgi:hypothetical protein
MAKKRRSRSERDGLRVKLVTQIVDNWSLCKDFKVRAYPLCLCIWFCQHLNSLLGLSTDFVSKIEVVSSSDPGLCEPSSHLSSSIALLSSPTYHFPPPRLQVNRGTCRFGRYKNPRRPHPPPRASRVSHHPPQVSGLTLAHPCSPTLTHRRPLDQSTPAARVHFWPLVSAAAMGAPIHYVS